MGDTHTDNFLEVLARRVVEVLVRRVVHIAEDAGKVRPHDAARRVVDGKWVFPLPALLMGLLPVGHHPTSSEMALP